MYWSAEHSTFLPAPDDQKDGEKKKDGGDKRDKVKTAKRIAKDMEKWAKTLNQKKEAAKASSSSSSSVAAPSPAGGTTAEAASRLKYSSVGSEDIAFSMLSKNKESTPLLSSVANLEGGGLAGLAGYGSDSDEESSAKGGGSKASKDPAGQFTDWDKLACLLCKRQFSSKEKLQK